MRTFTTLWPMAGTVTFAFIASSFWKRKISIGLYRNNETHVEDLKNLVEDQFPSGDHLFVVLRVETSRDHIPFTPLD